MSRDLNLQVRLSAIDKFTGPIRKIMDGSSGLAKSLRASKDLLKQLNQQQLDMAGNEAMQQEQAALSERIEAVNSAIKRQKDLLAGIGRVSRSIAPVSEAFGHLQQQIASLGQQALVAGAAGGFFFKTQLLDTASQFEKYEAILRTVEGSGDKARASMDWVSDFAARTPYDLTQVMDAFVKLRAYGLDPTNGLLRTLGDTSAAMGKDVIQAVEAIADAVTGENERLKEFGIKGSTAKGQITYEYTNRAGQQQTKTVAANNRKLIESTLTAIFNEKYAGAMGEMSKTWEGMVSNLGDQWTRFKVMVMKAGVFDWMKGQLGMILDAANRLAADGTLERYARQIGDNLKAAGVAVWNFGERLYGIGQRLAGMVGGWENLGLLLLSLKLVPVAAGLISVTQALIGMGAALGGLAATAAGGGILTKLGGAAASLAAVGGQIGGAWQAASPALFAASLKPLPGRLAASAAAAKAWVVGAPGRLAASLQAAASGALAFATAPLKWVAKGLHGAASAALMNVRLNGLLGASWGGLMAVLRGGFSAVLGAATGGMRMFGQAVLFAGRAMLFNPIGLALTALAVAGLALLKFWQPIKAFFSGFWQGLTQGLAPLAPLFEAVGVAMAPLKPLWDGLASGMATAWKWVSQLFMPFQATATELENATSKGQAFGLWLAGLLNSIAAVAGQMFGFGADIVRGLIDGIVSMKDAVSRSIGDIGESLKTQFKSILGIHSPSRVFAQLGGYTMQGLEQGLVAGQGGPLAAVLGMGRQLAAAGVVALGAGGLAAPALAALPTLDSRPPLAASAAAPVAGGQTFNFSLTINATPGANPDQLAASVRREMERFMRDQASRNRSALYDRQ